VADSRSTRNVWLTARDRRMLAFMAEHRMVLESQVVALLGDCAPAVQRRLRALGAKGYLTRWRVFEGSRCSRIRPRGLAAIGSRLTAPDLNLGAYRHDVGVAWLWLAAHRGVFGSVADVIGERRLRSHDMTNPEEPYSVRLGAHDAEGRERRHYPDLLLVDPHERRLALELELSPKQKSRREEILAGYGADRRLDGVVYLVEDNAHGRSIGRSVRTTAHALGLADRVHVGRVTPIVPGRSGADRSGGRPPRHADTEASR
jgi:hypothetical protein